MKTRYFYFLACFILAGLAITSCSDDGENDPQSKYYIRVKVDGKLREFKLLNEYSMGYDENAQSYFTFVHGAQNANGANNIVFELFTNTEIKTGVSYGVGDYTFTIQLQATDLNATGIFASPNDFEDELFKITEIKDNEMKGVFEGTLTTDIYGANPIKLTEGEFYVPKQK